VLDERLDPRELLERLPAIAAPATSCAQEWID